MKPWNAIRSQIPKRKKSGDVWIHFHTSPDDFLSHELSPLCNFLYEYICNKAPHPHIFSLIFTHFKWSKLGLKQNCEASLSPINQDFLESCQYVAVADEKYFYHVFQPPFFARFCQEMPYFQGFEHFHVFMLSWRILARFCISFPLSVGKVWEIQLVFPQLVCHGWNPLKMPKTLGID